MEIEVFFSGVSLEKAILSCSQYDLIFLDIEMEKLNGIEVARHIREVDNTVLIIYISGYEQYLKELFEVEPFRFLSKPLDKKNFYRYFMEAYQRIGQTESNYQFTFNKQIYKIPLRDIIYFESRNRVIYVYLRGGKEERFYEKLSNIEKELYESRYQFLRIHQSFLVNFNYIKRMNFSNVTLDVGGGKEIDLKISEDRQRNIRIKLCEIAGRKMVI